MKIWNKVKFPLLIALITAVMILIRFLTMAVPSWIDLNLIYPLIAFRFIFKDTWTNILLIAISAGAVMLVPCKGRRENLRRFLLRPALASLVILGLSNFAIASNDQWEKQLRQRQMDTTYQQIEEFLAVADEVAAYNTHSQHFGNRFRESFPELLLETIHIVDGERKTAYYYSDYILIDYDTQRLGIIYHQHGTLKFFEYQLKPVNSYPKPHAQKTITFTHAGTTLASYCPSGQLGQYTDGFALTLSDGSIYTITGLCRYENLFLDIQYATFVFFENWPS